MLQYVDMTRPWARVWTSGWAAAWPADIHNFLWAMAAGVQFFGAHRRWDNEADPGCQACAGLVTHIMLADTVDHLRTCPVYVPLWAAVARIPERAIYMRGVDVLAVLLCGVPSCGPCHADMRGAGGRRWW